jgi:hypothetical protein
MFNSLISEVQQPAQQQDGRTVNRQQKLAAANDQTLPPHIRAKASKDARTSALKQQHTMDAQSHTDRKINDNIKKSQPKF